MRRLVAKNSARTSTDSAVAVRSGYPTTIATGSETIATKAMLPTAIKRAREYRWAMILTTAKPKAVKECRSERGSGAGEPERHSGQNRGYGKKTTDPAAAFDR